MSEKTEKQLDDYHAMLTLLLENDRTRNYMPLSKIGRKLGRTSLDKKSLVRYNARLGYQHFASDELIWACIERTIEASHRAVIKKRRKSNSEAFRFSKARQAYAQEHQYDRPSDRVQLGLVRIF